MRRGVLSGNSLRAGDPRPDALRSRAGWRPALFTRCDRMRVGGPHFVDAREADKILAFSAPSVVNKWTL